MEGRLRLTRHPPPHPLTHIPSIPRPAERNQQQMQQQQQQQQNQIRLEQQSIPMAINQGQARVPVPMPQQQSGPPPPQQPQQQFMVQGQMHAGQQHQMSHMQQQMHQQQQQQQPAMMPVSQDPMSALQTMNPNSQGMAIGPQDMMRQQMPVQHTMSAQMAGGPRAGRMVYPSNQPQMLPPHGANSPGMPAHSWTPAGGPSTPMSVSSPRPQSGMVPSPAAPHYYNNVTLNTPGSFFPSTLSLDLIVLSLLSLYSDVEHVTRIAISCTVATE